MRTLKLILRNTMIYSLVFTMFFGSAITQDTVSLMKEVIAEAADGTYDGQIDVGNPQSATGGIISTPMYAFPGIKISVLYDENTQLMATQGVEAFYQYWGNKYPVTTSESNSVQGSFYMVTHYEDFARRGVNANNLHSFKYNGGDLIDEGAVGSGQTPARFLTSVGAQSFGTAGVYYDAIKNVDKATLASSWKSYANNPTRAQAAWYQITALTGEGGHGGSTSLGMGGAYNSIFNPNNLDLNTGGTFTDESGNEIWFRTLDALMSLWTISPDKTKPVWETAVTNHINGNGAAIMCEVSPILVFNSLQANEYFGIIPAMDYISYCAGVTSGNLIYGQNWYSTNSSHLGNIYSAIESSVNTSIAQDPAKDRYPSTGHYKTNAWSWGLTALTKNTLRTTPTGMKWTEPTVPTAFIEALGISNGGSGVWMAGYTIFGTSGAAPLSQFGVLSATPDNYHCGGATFGTNVSLTLYGGISEEDLGAWETIIDSAEQTGGNFTIQVNWSRNSGRETDGSGIGTFIDSGIAAGDPFLPSNSVHMSAAEDAKAATVVNNPTIVIFSPNEMREWIGGRRAITAYDAIAGFKVMHTNTKIDYTANIIVTLPNGEVMKGATSDTASFLMHEERIGYASTAQAYSEFKNYGVQSDMDGYLKEDFEAMGGVPSTEQMYFAAGGSEFIVDVGLNEAANETAYRTYDYYFTQTDCEYKAGDQSNESWTVPSISGVPGTVSVSPDYNLSVHGGDLTVQVTISGAVRNDNKGSVSGSGNITAPAAPNAGDIADRATAYASLKAWHDQAKAYVISHTSVSDVVTRTDTLEGLASLGGSMSMPGCPSNVPQTMTGSFFQTVTDAQGNSTEVPMAGTVAYDGDASWSVTASITLPCHVICGPCCEHIIPETHDTWTQTTQYDSMEINNIHVWRIDQGAIEGMEEILDLEYVSADILDDHPTIFYNIAQKNEDMKTYKKPVYGDTYKGNGKYSHHAKVGRMVYSVERDMCDKVVVCLGSRQNWCDGLAETCSHNHTPTKASGHEHFWAEGFIYTTSNEGYTTGRTGNTRNGETAFAKNPRNALNGAIETYGSNLSLNYVQEHTKVKDALDSKDWSTPEYQAFRAKREQQVTATMVTDFLILQTTSGVQSVMYFDQSQSTYVDAEMPNIDALGHPYNHDNGGALRNEVNGIDATAIPGGPISQKYWFSNANSASQWDPFEINIGSYTGMYWKGNEGNNGGGSTKFDGTGRSNAKATKFDDGPHGSMVMTRPGTASKLMMYTGELNLKLDLKNEAYYTDYSEVFFANQLHWAYDDWLRLNPEKNGLHLPYITKNGTSDYANFARLDTGSFVFDGDTPGLSYFFYDTNAHAKTYVGASGNAINKNEVTRADHQFDIEDYRVAAGYTQEAVYSDSTVGGNDYPKCNDIIIHDPVSTQDTALVSLPQYRDQRTGAIIGGAADVMDSINNSIECPREPGLCSFRVLNCHFLEDQVIFKTNFTPDANGYFVNSISGNSLALQPGFTLDKNNKFDNYALRAYGTRISIPFTEMDLSYNTSTKIRVEADIIINPTGKGQMIFSFNKYDVFLPASTEDGLNENKNLTINTGNGWELKASIPIADGKKHHLAVDFAFSNPENCAVYIDGKKASLQRYNESAELTPNVIGNTLNIGSWGTNSNYGANFWLDNLTVTRLAGTMRHGKECYSVQLQHAGGNNAHTHTAACLDNLTNTVAPGMVTKTIDGKLWGRVFWHNMSGGFFKDANEVLNTNTQYKYSVLDYIQKLKPQDDDKYTFRLEYGNTVSNIWRQTNRPQDEYLADTTNGGKFVTGYEAISIPHSGSYWGGLARSTTAKTYIDGSIAHSNWWFSIGTFGEHINSTTFPGYNQTNVTDCSIWMLLDDSYKRVNENEVSKTFNYTGAVQEYTVPITGYYRLEAWGASGGLGYGNANLAGRGGYTAGTVYLTANTKLFIYVGQQGPAYNVGGSAFNGGGAVFSGATAHKGGGGGGASDIRLAGGAWNNSASLQTRIIVAGGGGGAQSSCGGSNTSPGNGGGLTGGTSYNNAGSYVNNASYGGSQTAGGSFKLGSNANNNGVRGSFGQGAYANTCASGGGGGYYGGASLYTTGGGGGSSYVNGYAGCDTTYYNPNYTFTNVSLTQGGNVGNGKVTITRMTSTLANVMYWLYSGEKNEAELRELLGDAYDYVVSENQMTELYTYSNWSQSNNGFYHLTNGVNVDINNDGSFTIDTINGWECASAVDIEGSALRNIIITYRGSAKPNTSTGIQFVLADGSTSAYYSGRYSTNENGDTVCTIDLDSAIFGTNIKAIKYDIGSGSPTTQTATVKSIQINGYGSTYKETKVYEVSKSNTPGRYTYETNAFGNSLYDVELIGARGGDARITNTTTLVKNSGGSGANVSGQASFGGNDTLVFTVGGKGGDQASTEQVGGLSAWTQVVNVTSAKSFSYTMKAGKLYKVEMYGASGGSGSGYGHTTGSAGGYGGYSTGILQFSTDTTVYGYTGGQGVYGGTSATFNGGGAGGNGSSGSGGGATHLALANGTLASLNGNRSAVLMVAGGGGGSDNAGDNPGGGDDGSGGNGGGTTAQGAWVGGRYNSGYGATQTSGYAFGQGQNGSGTDTGGGGGGYFGGRASQHNNGGAGGGSGYINTNYVKSAEGVTAQTIQSNRVGCGIIKIYEAEYKSIARNDGIGGFNGGGNGGNEYGESHPESAAGGGGATDLRLLPQTSTKEVYSGDKLSNNAGTETVSGTTLTVNSTSNYNIYKGGNKARTAGERYIVTWEGSGLANSKIVIDGGIYPTDTSITTFQKDRGIILESVTKTDTKIIATYLITETSRTTEFRLETNGAPVSITRKTVQLDNSTYLLVAGGGGGAGSHLEANVTNKSNGGNASTLDTKGVATNTCVEAGTPNGGYAILAGQDGADGNRSNNYGAVGGAGGGYYGGKQIATNTSSMAMGGAGGGTYASNKFSKLSSVLKNSPNGSGDGYYKLDEHRETIIIRETNYNETSSHVLMQYYTLIPDKLSDGSPNPLWSNCKNEGNYHKCTKACKETKVLTCSEPHHQGLHYDIANEICWEACMNDANHRKSEDKIKVDSTYSFDIGNFINIDYGLTIFFPNRGDFYEGESYAIGALTSSKGLGFRDKYEVDEDYSDLPYGRGTDMCGGYVNTYVGMNTSKWTRVKRIKLPVNVIYDPTRDGKHAKLYLAGEWITLGDRGTYTSKIGGQGDSAAQGKYDEKAWSNYGTWKYEGIYREFYNFYCVLNNPEIKAGAYTVEVTALNASDFNGEGTDQKNDNPDAITNKMRTSSFYALHGGTNTRYFDVVGRIGNMIMDDVEDFRFSNLFKQALVQEEQTQVSSKVYYANKGLGIQDSAGTPNERATVDGTYVTTNAGNAFAAVKGVNVGQKYYKVAFEGKGLNVGRFEAVNVATKQPIEDNKIKIIQESSTKVSYYLDLSKVTDITKIDLKFIAKGSNVMAVNSCTFTELGSSPDSWLLDGIVREVDETKQNVYFTWVADIRGIKVGPETRYVDTWGTLSWVNGNWKDFPLSPDKNNIDILKDEPMLAGYSALMDIQTIGSYWKNDTAELQIIPKYYALDVNTGLMKKIDVYMEHEGTYVPINLADNVNKNNSSNPFNAEIFDNTINLDWDNTKERRNVTDEESTKTQQVYEDSIRNDSDQSATGQTGPEDVDIFRPIDIPRGHINVLGNNQYMILDGNARSFVGGVETYGSLKNLGNRLNPVHWYRSAQRWHFLVGIPSSAVFVLQGQVPNAANIDALQSGPYIIICTLDITAVGEVYALKYEHKYSGSQIAKDFERYYKNIVKDWTDVGTTGGVHMGSIQTTSNGVTRTINLNKYAEQLNYEPIVFVYSVNERSVQDVEIVGTH